MPGHIRTIVKKAYAGSAAIAISAAPPGDVTWELISLTAHYGGDPGVEDLTITLNSANGADYDAVLLTKAMSGVTSFQWGPDFPLYLGTGDTIDIAEANGNSVTYGIEITWGEVVS